jgi:hypothetical protein
VRRTCADKPALARRTSANAAEGSMFTKFLNELALPYAYNSKLYQGFGTTCLDILRREIAAFKPH